MRRFLAALLAMVLFCVCGTGCLNAKRREAVRYDAATDTFHVLRLYTDITAANDVDVAHLAALYANRDHVILYDPIAIFKERAAVPVGKHQAYDISLGEHEERPEISTTDLDLTQVSITPGKFFLSPSKSLCYYQQMSAPGKFVDQLLAQGSAALRTALVEEISKERERRKNGGQPAAWELARERILKNLEVPHAPEPAFVSTTPGATEPADPAPSILSFLSAASLDNLEKASAAETLAFSRKGEVVSLALPLAATDAGELLATLKQLRTALARRELVKKGTPALLAKETKLNTIVALLDGLTIASKPDGSLAASVKASEVVDLAMACIDAGEAEDAVKASESKATTAPAASQPETFTPTAPLTSERLIAALRAQGVLIDENLTLPEIVPAFKKGTLPANPSAKPVVPGTGLFANDKAPETAPAK